MAARRKTSKRPSATTSRPDEKITFFVDRSLGKRVRDAMRAAGAEVVYLEDEHAPDTSDEHWLAYAGRRGYVVVTKDKQIRTRSVERRALLSACVCASFLTSGNLTGREMADILTKQLGEMTRVAGDTPAPFLAIVTREAVTLLVDDRQARSR